MSTILNIISIDIRIVGLEIEALFEFTELKFSSIPTLKTEVEKGSI